MVCCVHFRGAFRLRLSRRIYPARRIDIRAQPFAAAVPRSHGFARGPHQSHYPTRLGRALHSGVPSIKSRVPRQLRPYYFSTDSGGCSPSMRSQIASTTVSGCETRHTPPTSSALCTIRGQRHGASRGCGHCCRCRLYSLASPQSGCAKHPESVKGVHDFLTRPPGPPGHGLQEILFTPGNEDQILFHQAGKF